MSSTGAPTTRYVIRLADGSYFVEKISKGNLRTTREIAEAHQFPTRFLALETMARPADAVFSQAAIQSWDPAAGKAP